MEDKTEGKLLNSIKHYQNIIIKHSESGNNSKVLNAISLLYVMPITVAHLQETGVGRTINSLRKRKGDVGEASRTIIGKWKTMVETEENSDVEDNDESNETDIQSPPSLPSERKTKSGNNHSSDISDQEMRHSSSEKKHRHRSNDSSHQHKHHRKEKSDRSSHPSEDKKHKKHGEKDRHREKERHEKKRKQKEESSNSKRKRYDSESEIDIDDMNIAIEHLGSTSQIYDRETIQLPDPQSEPEPEPEIEQPQNSHHSKHKKHQHKSDKHRNHEKEVTKEKLNGHHSKKSSHREKEETAKIKKVKPEKCDIIKEKPEPVEPELATPSPKTSKSKSRSTTSTKISSPSKIKKEKLISDDGIDCGSGASFAEALGMLGPTATIRTTTTKKKASSASPTPSTSSSKSSKPVKLTSSPLLQSPNLLVSNLKLEPLDINLVPTLPEITTNYKPLPNYTFDASPQTNSVRQMTEEEALEVVITSKTQRTKVYSGNKTNYGFVPTLFNICVRVLQDNIDSLEYTGGVPYEILKPVLERATADQLFMSEHYNPYLIEDTDELWGFHCKKEFRANKRQEMESWRDMYMRCLDEREAKLKALTANIKQAQDKSLPVRQTKLAYVDSVVKPPRGIARKQAKYGTDKKPLVTPSSRLNSIAAAGIATSVAVPNPGARASSSSSSSGSIFKPKKAPLMQKTLAALKGRFRR